MPIMRPQSVSIERYKNRARTAELEVIVERLQGAALRNMGTAVDPNVTRLDLKLTFDAKGGTASASSKVSTPVEVVEKDARQAAADLASRSGRTLGPLEMELLVLELEDIRCLRNWAKTFAPLKGQQRRFLLGEGSWQDVNLEDMRKLLDVDTGHGLLQSLNTAATQLVDMEAFSGNLLSYCHHFGPAHQTSAALSSVQFVESKAAWWVDAADGLVQMLESRGVQHGQVIAIDAHTEKPEEEAQFSAHYCTSLPGWGGLGIRYKRYEVGGKDFSWEPAYKWANDVSKNKQIISMTGSRNRGGGGVFGCFYYVDACNLEDIQVVEARDPELLFDALVALGVRAGQVLWVDAHHRQQDDMVSLAAHYSKSLPDRGLLLLKCEVAEKRNFQELSYWASVRLTELQVPREDFVSITCTKPLQGSPVCYLFYTTFQSPDSPETNQRPLPPWPEPPPVEKEESSEEAPPPDPDDDFMVVRGKVVFTGVDVHVMPAVELEACKDLCRRHEFGAFIVTNNMAYFRIESMQKCLAHLVEDPRSTTYIRKSAASFDGPFGKLHHMQRNLRYLGKVVGGEAPMDVDGVRHEACQCTAQ